jgi:type IV fimbrial biogenesis protein FimT
MANGRGLSLGMTLVETMVALAVMSILALISVPNLTHMMSRQAVASEVGEFQEAIRRTRMEAVRRGVQVSICARDAGAGDQGRRCAVDGNDWRAGWLIFVDRGERGELEEGDELLVVHQATQRLGPVQGTLRYISFQPTGISTSAASHYWFVPFDAQAGDEQPDGSLLVCVNKPGRTRALRQTECS